uniref:Capsid protein n=1 Tax=Periparus ater Genomoviridae sp. TaxID=2814985 RepID=A0A8A4XCY6_9VIRU|nr:MAG: capsid protein [Gemykolovirus]UBQ66255.1 Cap protein [finch CRESS-DNA virus]
MAYNRLAKLRRDRAYIRRRGGMKKYFARQRYAARTRRYAKKTRKTYRPMSRKRILNATSRKKRNTMLSWSNTNGTGASQTVALGNLLVPGSTGYAWVPWHASAMDIDTLSVIPNDASRTASTCYMVGLAENLKFQTSTGLPWFHRRICFTIKGPNPFAGISPFDTTAVQQTTFFTDTSNGMERLWFNLQVNNSTSTLSSQQALLFKGVQGKDWTDVITAPVDNLRVSVKYDRTRTISSGNSNGVVREHKMFHSMRKNLVYDDEEAGQSKQSTYYSVDSKLGMGDFYVIDIIQPGSGGTASDLLLLGATSTLYWHEK